jgi:hypothetical protein
MSKKYPPISAGTSVVTTQENPALRDEWTEEAKAGRKWGIHGIVTTHHDSHGLCYEVLQHDGTVGFYDPSELEEVSKQRRFAAKTADLMGQL